MSKGSSRRPCQIDKDIEDIRWQLISSKTSQERKAELLVKLQELEKAKLTQSS